VKAKILIALLTLFVGVIVFALGVIIGAATVSYRHEEQTRFPATGEQDNGNREAVTCVQRSDGVVICTAQ
jgi:hypothetical protein